MDLERVRDVERCAAILLEVDASGESIAGWCRKHGVDAGGVYRLRYRARGLLREREQTRLVPVHVTPSQVNVAPSAALYEIRLPSGVELRVADDFASATLVRLVRALEEAC